MTKLSVSIGEHNGDGRRHVVYEAGGREYPDSVDLASGFQREQSMKRALAALGLPSENLPALDAEVARLAKVKDEGKAESKERFSLVTSAALDGGDYTPRPIITDCMYAGHPMIDGGMFKTLKTLLAVDATISISSGHPFLNCYSIPEPMVVVYFTGEGGPSMAQDYGRRVAAAKGLGLADVRNLHWCFSVPKLESLNDLDAVQRIHDDTSAEVMVFDNLMLCMGGDEAGNVFKMGQVLSNAIRICNERNITPVFVHHFKRTRATQDPYAPGELLDLTQAGAAEVAGQWWLLTRREAFNPDEPGEHRLWLNIGGRLGHGCLHALDVHEGRLNDPGGRRWEVDVLAAEDVRTATKERQDEAKRERAEEKAAALLDSDRREVVKILAKTKEPQTKSDLRGMASATYPRFNRAFLSLVEDGTLQSVDVPKGNNRMFAGWKLRDETSV
jgi:hypothetical protein